MPAASTGEATGGWIAMLRLAPKPTLAVAQPISIWGRKSKSAGQQGTKPGTRNRHPTRLGAHAKL